MGKVIVQSRLQSIADCYWLPFMGSDPFVDVTTCPITRPRARVRYMCWQESKNLWRKVQKTSWSLQYMIHALKVFGTEMHMHPTVNKQPPRTIG